jgi:hypothetical protein
MSRPLKLKVTGAELRSAFQLPDHGCIRAVCGGAPQTFLPSARLRSFPMTLPEKPAYHILCRIWQFAQSAAIMHATAQDSRSTPRYYRLCNAGRGAREFPHE